MRFAGAYWLMGWLSERPKGRCSGRDFTRTGFLALASLMISSALMRPCVMRSTSPAQRAGTYSIFIQWCTTARSSWKARAASAWLPKISTSRSTQFTARRLACQAQLDKPAFRASAAAIIAGQPMLKSLFPSAESKKQAKKQALEAAVRAAEAAGDLRRFGEAAALFERALALKPDFAEAHFNLGLARFEAADLRGAAREFARSAALARGAPWDAARRADLARDPEPRFVGKDMGVNP